MESDSGKEVWISGRDEEKQAKATPADPQLQCYFAFLYLAGLCYMLVMSLLPAIFEDENDENASPFKAAYGGGFFMIMTIVSLFVSILASGLLIFTSHFLQSLMRDIHYTVLRTIGCFSATTACFCLLVILFVPSIPYAWIAYPVICILFAGLLYICCFLWDCVCARQPHDNIPIRIPATYFLVLPTVFVFAFTSHGLPWIRHMIFSLNLTVLVSIYLFIAYMTLIYGKQPHQLIQQDNNTIKG